MEPVGIMARHKPKGKSIILNGMWFVVKKGVRPAEPVACRTPEIRRSGHLQAHLLRGRVRSDDRQSQLDRTIAQRSGFLIRTRESRRPSLNCFLLASVENMVPAIRISVVLLIILALTSPALLFSGEIIRVADTKTAGTADECHSRSEEETHGIASVAFLTRAAHKETGKRRATVQLRRTGPCRTAMHQSLARPVIGHGATRARVAGRSSSHPQDIPLYICSLLI